MGSKSHHKISLNIFICLVVITFGFVQKANGVSTLATSIQSKGEEPEITNENDETDLPLDLEKAETKDAKQKLEIIKQIRRLNSDGSYTVGYEADDGTFKIESRDVLGNVKGTYGYVDINGEIKRVSYTANNSTHASPTEGPIVQSTPTPTPNSIEAVQIPRQNRTSFGTTRRPAALAYLTNSPTRATVIQPIPKKKLLLTSSSERPTYNHYSSSARQNLGEYSTQSGVRKPEPTTTVVYATSVPTARSPTINIRPTVLPSAYKTAEQISRPDKLEITDHISKVQISSNRDTSTAKPVVEDVNEKDTEKRTTQRNYLRRQLDDNHDEKFEEQQQVVYRQAADVDTSHLYSGGTARPLYTTSAPSRIPNVVLQARNRAALLQNVINANNAQKQIVEKVYAQPPRRRPEVVQSAPTQNDSEQTTESTSENNYITQEPVDVQIQANRVIQQATEEDKRVYRRPVTFPPQVQYRQREFVRQSPPSEYDYSGPRQYRIPIPQAYPQQYQPTQPQQYPEQLPQHYSQVVPKAAYSEDPRIDENEQYLRETTLMSAKNGPLGQDPASANEYSYQAQRGGRGRQYLPYQPRALPQEQRSPDGGYGMPSIPVPYQPNPYEPQPYNRIPPVLGPYNENPDRPLTTRDFERLLNLLVVKHQQLQRYNNYRPINPYLLGGGGGYNNFGYQQIPRPPLYNPYDPRYDPYQRLQQPFGQYSDAQENMYQPQPNQPDQQVPYAQRLVPRRNRQYQQQQPYYAPQGGIPPDYPEASQHVVQHANAQSQEQSDYLPPDIREELLYRMLLLAMHSAEGNQAEASNPEPVESNNISSSVSSSSSSSTTSTTTEKNQLPSPTKQRKPVRSVQILGEE